ncbi:MAG: hypothetical protein ABSG73_06150 [Candidatus Aminicenantales bacterium]|jgi:hypothetical protein
MAKKDALTLVLVLVCAAGLARCRRQAGLAGVPAKVPAEAPAASPAGLLSGYETIVVDIKEVETVPDIDLGGSVSEYLETELRREFKGTVVRRAVGQGPAVTGDDKDRWASAGAGLKKAVFLVGTAGLRGQAQKALQEAGIPKDGPFRLENRGLAERKRFSLAVECSLIDASNGETILKKIIKETRTYSDIQQTAEFALFDLLPAVKASLFSALFGRAPVEKRDLLAR